MYVVCLQSEQQLYLDCWFDRLLGKSVALLPCIHLHWFDSPLGKSAALSPYSHLQEKRKKRALLTTMQKKRWRLVLYSRLGRADLAFMLMQKHLAPPNTHTHKGTHKSLIPPTIHFRRQTQSSRCNVGKGLARSAKQRH